MDELMEFLTSKEVLIVITVAVIIFVIGAVYFIVERFVKNKRMRKNTLELNESIKEEEKVPVIEKNEEIEEKPKVTNNVSNVVAIEQLEETPVVPVAKESIEAKKKDSIADIFEEVKEEVKKQEELTYTEIVPNKEEAKEELRKVTEELLKEEEDKNIELTKFEEEQEENAIISMDELLEKSGVLYQKNEITQYLDEGNEPISLEDLEKRMDKIKIEATKLDLIDDKEKKNKVVVKDITPQVVQTAAVETNKVKLDDFNTIKEPVKKVYQEDHIFQKSPIISPIFGIEKEESSTNMELENTANYEKFDDEIKKTNEFLTTLKELQKKLN